MRQRLALGLLVVVMTSPFIAHAASLLETAKVVAPDTYPSSNLSNLTDCNDKSAWNANSYAPAGVYFEIPDNHEPISAIRLIPAQTPAGKTTHAILVSGPENDFKLAGQIWDEFSQDGVPIIKTFDPPLKNIQKIWVFTMRSPSWAAWYEIQAYSSKKELALGCKK